MDELDVIIGERGDERRMFVSNLELRADDEAGSILEGYAALFNQETQIGGSVFGWIERIAPGTFAESIVSDDIRALFNHDPNLILGRNRAKTLTLMEDTRGLKATIHAPDTTIGRDLLLSVKRGDITGMSFGFRARKEEWVEPADETALPHRTLLAVQLFDVSAVTFPCYAQTSIAARNHAQGYQEAARRDAQAADREADADRVRRLRLAQTRL